MSNTGGGYTFQILPQPACTTTAINVQGSRGSTTTITSLSISYLANLFSALTVGTKSFSNTWGSIGVSVPSTYTSANGANGNFFINGYSGNVCGWPLCQYFGLDYGSLWFSGTAAGTTINVRDWASISKLDISYILF